MYFERTCNFWFPDTFFINRPNFCAKRIKIFIPPKIEIKKYFLLKIKTVQKRYLLEKTLKETIKLMQKYLFKLFSYVSMQSQNSCLRR